MIDILKSIIEKLPIRFTQNQKYDYQTKLVIEKVCKADSYCIGVGCHKGEVLDLFIYKAKSASHWGFEPIPVLFYEISKKYFSNANIQIKQIALSNCSGKTSFNYVLSNPSYSGIKKGNMIESTKWINKLLFRVKSWTM